MKTYWTKEKLKLLMEKYRFETYENLEKIFVGKSIEQIKRKARKMRYRRSVITDCGGRGKVGRFYSKHEVSYILSNYKTKSISEMSNYLKRSKSSISNKMYNMGIKQKEVWSSEEEKLMREIYSKYENEILSKKYFKNRSVASISHKAIKMNLQKNSDFIKNNPKITKEECILKLVRLSKKLKRTPTISELSSEGLPSLSTYRLLFGNYTNACIYAGLTPNFSKIGVGKKAVLMSNNNDACYSISEQIITNFFIFNNISYAKEVPYRRYSKDKRCRNRRADWVLWDGTFVEFWGFEKDRHYVKRMKEKMSICKESDIELISIYPRDINSLSEIFKKYINQNP